MRGPGAPRVLALPHVSSTRERRRARSGRLDGAQAPLPANRAPILAGRHLEVYAAWASATTPSPLHIPQ
jgi:hypothetical protein